MSLPQPPDGWGRVVVGDLGFVYGGLSGKSAADFGCGEARYVTFLDVINNVRVDGRNAQTVQVGPRESQNRVRKGDVLFNGTSETPDELALAAVVTDEIPNLYLNSFCFGLRPYDQDRVEPLFLAYLFRSGVGRELMVALAQGATRYNLSKKQFSRLVLPLPSLAEQRRIAAALSDVDDLIESLRRLVRKKRDVLAGAREDLLTRRLRVGNAGTWERVRLADVVDVDPENLTAATEPGFRFDYVALEDVDRGRILGSTKQIYRSAPSRARRVLRRGDVLFGTVRPNLQSHARFTGSARPAVCSTGFAVLRPRRLEDSAFVFHLLFSQSVVRQIDRLIAGSNYPAVSSRDVAALEVPWARQGERSTVAEVLEDLDADIVAHERRLAKTRAVEQGMMQELLTGRTRLPAEDVAA